MVIFPKFCLFKSYFMTLVLFESFIFISFLDDLHLLSPLTGQGCWRLIGRRVRIQDISAEGCSRNDPKKRQKNGDTVSDSVQQL